MATNVRFWPSIASAIVIGIGTIVFAIKRNHFPISERVPWLGYATALVVFLIDVMYFMDNKTDDARTCAINTLAVTILCLPLGIFCYLLRATLLLFRFEISRDLEGKANLVGQQHPMSPLLSPNGRAHTADDHKQFMGHQHHQLHGDGGDGDNDNLDTPSKPSSSNSGNYASSPHHHHRYSWYSRHSYLISPRYIMGGSLAMTSFCLIIFIVVAIQQQSHSCDEVTGWTGFALYMCISLCVIQAVILSILAKKLARHGVDNLGLKLELRFVAIIVLLCAALLFPIVIIVIRADDMWPVVIVICATAAWCASIVYPLGLMCAHARRLRRLTDQVQRFTSLSQFLDNPVCLRHYAAYVSAELSGEGLAFFLRCRAFKAHGGDSVVTSVATDVDRIVLLSQPSSSTATTTTTTTTITPTGAKTTTARTVALKPVDKMKTTPLQRALKEAYQINRSFIVADAHFEVNLSAAVKRRIANHLKSMATAVAAATRTALAMNNNNNGGGTGTIGGRRTVAINIHTSHSSGHQSGGQSEADALLLNQILSTFDEAMDEIVRLLQQNSFCRFKASKAYTRLIDELQQAMGHDDAHSATRHSVDESLHGHHNNTTNNGTLMGHGSSVAGAPSSPVYHATPALRPSSSMYHPPPPSSPLPPPSTTARVSAPSLVQAWSASSPTKPTTTITPVAVTAPAPVPAP